MGNIAALAARYAGRPVLMEPRALMSWAARIRDVDARAFERPGRIEALFRRFAGTVTGGAKAMEDDEGYTPVPVHEKLAYQPRYVGEVDDIGYCWSLKNNIALMCADAPLLAHGDEYCGSVFHGYDTLLNGMSEAAADDRVRAIFLKMDCPGGVVAPGIVALADWMRANRQSAGGKPIWVHADMACSAAMWIAAQADRILSPSMGYLGSIGAYMLHEDATAYLDKMGIGVTEIKFGSKKTDGAYWKALSPEAKADLQAEIDQVGRNFLAAMIAGRPNLTEQALIDMQAACYFADADDPARSGLKLGLADAIQTEEQAFAALLDSVSAPAISNLAVAAPAGRAKATNDKEQPMALTAEQKAAKLAALKDEETRLTQAGSVNVARLAAIKTEKAAVAAEPDPEDTGETTEDDETEENPATPTPDKDKKDQEAAKISASTEAQKFPHLALAAISSGQTLAQFQATVKAQSESPRGRGALALALENSPRLGPDGGGKSADAMAELNPTAIYASRNAKRAG
jgi:ClpP class serine protease